MTMTQNIDALSTPKGRVLEASTAIRRREAQLAELREALPRYLRQAQKAGASIAELQEWTGYSRRMVFYLLKDSEPA